MDRATQQFFYSFESAIRREAELLQGDGSVRQIFGGPKFVQARVKVEREFRVRLEMIAGRWEASVEPSHKPESEIAACVVMLERLLLGNQLPVSPLDTDDGDIRERLADAMGRELKPQEAKYLEKLEKRYRRYEMEGAIFDHDLVRLSAEYPMGSDEPLQLWREEPRDVVEFWNYLAYEFEKQGISYPAFLRKITDTKAVRRKLESWERQQELSRWEGILSESSQPLQSLRKERVQLRLQLSFTDVRLQWREWLEEESAEQEGEEQPGKSPRARKAQRAEKNWQPLRGAQQLQQWLEAQAAGELQLDALSELILRYLGDAPELLEEIRWSLNAPQVLQLLSRLVRQHSLRERIVDLDEEPLIHVSEAQALRWELRETDLGAAVATVDAQGEQEDEEGDAEAEVGQLTSGAETTSFGAASLNLLEAFNEVAEVGELDDEEEDEEDEEGEGLNEERFCLQLVYADGSKVYGSMRILPGAPSLYLGDEAIFHGPEPLMSAQGVELPPKLPIPAEILESQAGLDWLEQVDAELTPELRQSMEEVNLTLRFKMRIASEMTCASSEHAALEVEAVSADGLRQEKLLQDRWEVVKSGEQEGGEPRLYRRGLAAKVLDILAGFEFTWDAGEGLFRARVTKNFPENFALWLKNLPKGVEVELDTQLESLRADPLLAEVKFELQQGEGDIDWFDLRLVMEVEGLDLSQERLRQLVAKRGGFVRVEDGRWLRLQVNLSEEQIELVERLGLDPFDLSGESHRMHTSQLADPQAQEIFDAQTWEMICERAAQIELATQEEPPEGLKAELRPYQLSGFRFLCYLSYNQFGGVLADDMGLGKTVQSLSWLLWLQQKALREKQPARCALVVAPKSVLDVWKSEAAKFTPSMRTRIVATQDEFDFADVHEKYDLLVMNYAQLRSRKEELCKIKWRAIVLDEGQQIKNPDSQAAKVARSLDAEHRLVLTGTPIENRLLDLWSVMAFAQPGVLGNRQYFRKRFDRRKDPASASTLSSRLRPFLLRRNKQEVAIDLPPRIEEDIFTTMEGSQLELYERELKSIREQLLSIDSEEGLRKNNMAILTGLMRLRQVCCHPGLVDSRMLDEQSTKIESLFYLLDQLHSEGHKVLVFSQFLKIISLIEERLKADDRPSHVLTGQTRDRQKVIRSFQESKDADVFLLSLKAGGTGLNLTQASYVVLFDPWWNPAVENQAIDRVHRIGQENKVIAYRLLVRDSIEQKIRLLQRQKQEISKGVLGQGGFANSLNLEDVRYLFQADEHELELERQLSGKRG